MRNLIDGLLILAGMAAGNFTFTVLANILNIPYERMGLYCFLFAMGSLCILTPYFFIKNKLKTKNKIIRLSGTRDSDGDIGGGEKNG